MWTLCGFVAAQAGIASASPPTSSYRLVFADEFNGNSLNTSKWSAASPSWTMPNSDSTASASDVSVGNGVLTLTANRSSATGSFDSGSVSSYNKFTLTSGYFEARIQLPTTPGSWPAFWGLYTGWPPEADIMEYPLTTNGGTNGLKNNQYNTNFHYTNSSGAAAAGAGPVTTGSNLGGSYHTFGMNWIANTSTTFYLDGNQVSSYSGSAVGQMASMYMILDYAVGGWPGVPSTSQWAVGHSDTTKIDWVRAWQLNSNSDANSNWTVNGGGAFSTSGNWSLGVPKYGNETAYFGRVGSASTAAISLSSWQLFGGIAFDGATTGSFVGATAYTLGSTSNQIQLASTTGNATISATAANTASQTINAGVELWSNVNIDNNGSQPINMNGALSGSGNLVIDGVASVVLSGVGSYTGVTTIGSASGPAVLRANANSALSTGTVTIGAAGNGTTARLEVAGSHTLPNNIQFSGRNNSTVGIESVSGNNTLSGGVVINSGGGTYLIQSDAGSTLTFSGAVSLQSAATGNRTVALQGSGNGFVTGKIQDGSGTLGLTLAGPGTWTFSGSNTYSGPTAIIGGALVLNNVNIGSTSGVTVNSGARLSAKGSITTGGVLTSSGTIDLADGAVGTLSVKSGLSLSNAVLNMDVGNTTSDRIAAAGAATITGTNVVNIGPVLGQSMAPGTSYTLITATSGLSSTNFSVGTKPASLGFFNFALSTPTSSALLVGVSGSPVPTTAYWTGKGSVAGSDGSNNWGAGAAVGTSNWSASSSGSTDAQQLPGAVSNVVFNASNATGSGVLNTQLDAGYVINGLTFDVPAAPAITSAVLKTNGNYLTVGGNGVTLASTSNASCTINGSGTILVNGLQSWANNNNANTLNIAAPVSALSGATTLTFNGTGTAGVNVSSVLSDGAGQLYTAFNQSGTTILSASNNYTGTTTVTGGTVQIPASGRILSDTTVNGGTLMLVGGTDEIGDGNSVTVNNGGTFDLRAATGGAAKTETIGMLNGNGVVTRGTSGLTTLSVISDTLSGSFSGNIQNGTGTIALVKGGAGTLALGGSNNYTGGTTINDAGGALLVTNPNALGTGSVTIGQGNTDQSGELQIAGGIALAGISTINFESRTTSDVGGSPDLENLSDNNTISANLNINNTGGSAVNILSTAGKLTLNGNLSSTGLSSARGYDFYGAGDGQVNGKITNGTAQPTFVQMDGPGTWTLTNSNTFTGGLTVNGGTIIFAAGNNFGAGSIMANSGAIVLQSNNIYTGGTNIDSGTVIMGAPSALGSGTINLVAGGLSTGTLIVQTDGGDNPYNINIASGDQLTIVSDLKTGSIGINHTLGTLSTGRITNIYVEAGGNVGTGNPAITLGNVTLSSGFGAGSTTFIPDTANLTLGAVTTSTNSAKTLVLDGTSTASFVGGVISDGSNVLTVEKSNSSTWTLSALNTYSGPTIVDAGTLNVTGAINNGNTANVGQITVGDLVGGATLNISGTVNATDTTNPSLAIGTTNTASGAVIVNNGTLNVTSEVWVSGAVGSPGTLALNGGVINVGSWLAIGRSGDSGNLNVTAGTINVTAANLTLASFAGNAGSVTITGGTINTTSTATGAGSVYVGESGTGQLVISGTGAINISGPSGLQIAKNAGSTGTVNLGNGSAGGIITTPMVAGAGTSSFYFNGGTLRASASSAAFLKGLTTTQIRNGGGTIDTQGFAITVAQPLNHSTIGGDNATDGGLTKAGSGLLLLTGTSSYNGSTNVSAGTLDVFGTLTAIPSVTLNNAAGLIIDSANALPLTVAITGLGSTSGVTANASQTIASINSAGSLNVNAAATVNVSSSAVVGPIANAGTVNINGGASNTTGAVSGAGVFSVTGGSTTATSVRQGTLNVAATASVAIAYDSQAHTGGTPLGTSVVNSLNLNPAGTLDLRNNGIVILDTTALGSVQSLITQAADVTAGVPKWDMPGITSSTAATDPTGHAIGYALASTLGSSSFNGVTFSDAVIARYTLVGDSGLKGTVDLSDYTKVVLNLGKSNALWSDGNFDYSGNVNLGDYTKVVLNIGRTDGQSTVFNATGPTAQQFKASSLTLKTSPAIAAATTATDVTLLVNPSNGRVTLVNALQTGQAVITAYTINSPSQSLLPFSADGGGKYLANALENNPSVFYKASNGLTYNLWTGIKNVSTFIGEGFSNHYNANVDSTWTNYTLATSGYALGTLFKRLSSGGTRDLVFQWEDANLNTYTSVVNYVNVPEPGSVSLISLGALAMLGRRRRSVR